MILDLYGEKVEIDDEIYNEIKSLNEKGYYTAFCCGGHKERSLYTIYVTFINKHNFPVLPNGFILYKGVTVSYCIKNPTEEKYDVALSNFKYWVNILPNLKT